jgi:hypothetical protein
MACQDAVFDRASMERKSKMRAAVIEGKYVAIIIHDEQGTVSAANDDLTRGPQLLQGRRANEVIAAIPRGFFGPTFGHEN